MNQRTKLKRDSGFSLIELSVVITILAISLSTFVATSQDTAPQINKKKLFKSFNKIEKALDRYYQSYGHYPCPADGSLAISSTYFGIGEGSNTGTCATTSGNGLIAFDSGDNTGYIGILPTRTLSLSPDDLIDSWGNRISYAVSKVSTAKATSSQYAPSLLVLRKYDTESSSVDPTDPLEAQFNNLHTDKAAYVLISHGADGMGAYNYGGGTARKAALNTTGVKAGRSAEQLTNSHINADGSNGTFTRVFLKPSTPISSAYFDDIVVYKEPTNFSPPINGLTLWLDAEPQDSLGNGLSTMFYSDTGCTTEQNTNASTIACWTSRAEGTFADNSTAAERPALSLNGLTNPYTSTAMNAIYFDGTDDYLDAGDIINTDGYTKIIVFRIDSSATLDAPLIGSGETSKHALTYDISAKEIEAGNGASLDNTASQTTITPAKTYIVTSTYTNSGNGSSDISLYINGIFDSTDSTNNTFTDDNVTIGSHGSSTAALFKGKIAEILLYKYALSDADRLAAELYLREKWDVEDPRIVLHFDADEATSLRTDACGGALANTEGAPLTCWEGISTEQTDASKSTSSQRPTIDIANTETNGRTVVVFDGSDDYLETVSTPAQDIGHNFTTFIVGTTNDNASTSCMLSQYGTALNSYTNITFGISNNTRPFFRQNDTDGVYTLIGSADGAVENGEYFLLTAKVTKADNGLSDIAIYKNGVSVATASGIDIKNVNVRKILIGRCAGTANYVDGNIAEIITYNTALSDTEREAQEEYLMKKWFAKEFVLHAAFTGDQLINDIAALKGGGFVAVLTQDSGQDGDSSGIYAMRFDDNGEEIAPPVALQSVRGAVGNEFSVNSFTTGGQSEPAIAALKDGGFIIVWQGANGQDGNRSGSYGKRYNSDGEEVSITTSGAGTGTTGNDFLLNTHKSNYQNVPDVTALADGGWITTWESHHQAYTDYTRGVYAKRYDSAGDEVAPPAALLAVNNAVGNEFYAPETPSGDQYRPHATELTDGGWLLYWYGQGLSTIAKRYNSSGEEVTITTSGTSPATGNEFSINTDNVKSRYHTEIRGLPDGGWIAAWEAPYQRGSGARYSDIYAKRFDSSGDEVTPPTSLSGVNSASGNEFYVNEHVWGWASYPSLTVLQDGGWLISWHSDNEVNGDEVDIVAKRFKSTGEESNPLADDPAPIGNDGFSFGVNTTIPNTKKYAHTATLSNGNIVIAWQSESQDPADAGTADAYGSYARIFAGPNSLPETASGELTAWYDTSASATLWETSDCTTTIASEGSTIGCWKDRSGNGNHATQTDDTSYEPTLTADTSGDTNYRPTLKFDGTNDYFDIPDAMLVGTDYTIFAVAKRTTTENGNHDFIIGTTSGTGNNSRINFGYRESSRVFTQSHAVSPNIIDTVLTVSEETNFSVFSARLDSAGGTGKALCINGGSCNTVANNNQLTSNPNSRIAYFSSSAIADISVAEILIYTSALSDLDRTKIEAYLKTKWGTP